MPRDLSKPLMPGHVFDGEHGHVITVFAATKASVLYRVTRDVLDEDEAADVHWVAHRGDPTLTVQTVLEEAVRSLMLRRREATTFVPVTETLYRFTNTLRLFWDGAA